MSAVEGGVLFSLSFDCDFSSVVKSVEDFDLDSNADRPVDDLVFLGFFPPGFSGDDVLRALIFSLPTKAFNDTELFVLMCMPRFLLSSSYTSIGFRGEMRV